jgi:hypothetical protein
MWNLWLESVNQTHMAHGPHLKVSGVSKELVSGVRCQDYETEDAMNYRIPQADT